MTSLYRTTLASFVDWQQKRERKPLILYGVRQCGKSHLVREKFAPNFARAHIFDFKARQKELTALFAEDFDTHRILQGLSLLVRSDVDIENDLVVFDEVQECMRAVESLKYFCEQHPRAYIVALGSMLRNKVEQPESTQQGHFSFPVGKVEHRYLYPMSFHEFLLASGDEVLIAAYERRARDQLSHEALLKQYLDYQFVGGMPEAVVQWFSYPATQGRITINERVRATTEIHTQLLQGYRNDFIAKENVVDGPHITAVYDTVFSHLGLQTTYDGNLNRFKFKGVVPRKNRYDDLRSPIDWLVSASLLHKIYQVRGQPHHNPQALIKENLFKLLPHDIGLVNAQLGHTYLDLTLNKLGLLRGVLAEAFVANELIAAEPAWQRPRRLMSWSHPNGDYEIEFLIKDDRYGVYPIEVKAGSGTRAPSLTWYQKNYAPQVSVKLTATVGSKGQSFMSLPLYYAAVHRELLED